MLPASDIERRFRHWLADIRASLLFLTRLPVGGAPPVLPRALRAFPVAGAVAGLVCAVVLLIGLAVGVPPLAAALLALAGRVWLTGGLHEDGLADVADGFGGGAEPADKLRIMKDSRLGSYGALALVLAIGLQAALLADLSFGLGAWTLVFCLVAAGAGGRMAAVAILGALPPVRAGGLGESAGHPDTLIVLSAALATTIFALPALLAHPGGVAAGLAVAALAIAIFTILTQKQIGGQTGDVAGAAVAIAESAILVGLAAA